MDRFYEVDGKLLVSVTTALGIIRKPQLEFWRGAVGNREADRIMYEAADLGKWVHGECHKAVTGAPFAEDPLVDAFCDWFQACVKEVIFSEVHTWSLKYGYAGTPDLGVILKGDRTEPTVVDIKTTGAVWKDVALQLAAYQNSAWETLEIKIKRRMALHLDKKNPLRRATIKEFTNDSDFNHFLYALNLYKYFEEGSLNEREVIRPGQYPITAGAAAGQ